MHIILEVDRLGCLMAYPASDRVARRLERELGISETQTCLYMQDDREIAAFLSRFSPSVRRAVDEGNWVKVRMDDETYAEYLRSAP